MGLMSDPAVVARIFQHIDHETTDLGAESWREPVANYRSEARFVAEREQVLRRHPTPFCPSAALPGPGAWLAREAAGTSLLAARGGDGQVRVFRNACRHRGSEVATGSGCTRAFVCPYHGWSYGLDGALRHVPHAHGFPGLDPSARGLVPVDSREQHGIVFVTQTPPARADSALDPLPAPLIGPGYRLAPAHANEREVRANWKIVVEGFLEGYHIRATHRQTFYPVQFDNLNVVESFGRNSRIAYPYRAVHRLRVQPAEERSADGVLTYVYHLFPNAIVATFPSRIFLVVVEPLALDRTKLVTFALTNRPANDAEAEAAAKRGAELVDAGGEEDRAAACSVQRGLESGANEFVEFGLFEAAIGHFHRTLHAALGEGEPR